ncbi:MAG: CDP-glycerol glycerophosphotransferase family protein [Chloroflexota bacterium]|nr:CDP-glycerol glycerophosphotransferase family protein [Chloroflexota bacterium]|tara:strand:- start:70 stop:1557 length:1488 start_codon:yes stop_codon:yes gene_type:complete
MQSENNNEIKKIIIVPGNFFVSRNFFSSPLIENLQQISIKEKITIYIAGVESNPISSKYFKSLKNYFEGNYNMIFIPLMDTPSSPISRFIWYLKNNFLHKTATYRFNEINDFITHKRYKEITKLKIKNKFLWKTDIWPKYLGFPFPKSKLILKVILRFMSTPLTSRNPQINKHLKEINPDLLILGDIQSPVSFDYVSAAKKQKIKIAGNVRTWDHLTKNGPVVPGLDEYWVWNPIMRTELELLHKIPKNKIFEVGSPQFDYYFFNEINEKNLIDYFNIKIPESEFLIDDDAELIFFATNRSHRGIGEESIIHHICENIALGKYNHKKINLILRSHPYDTSFNERFKEFNDYPFVRLFKSPDLSEFNPDEFREDMIKVNLLLKRSKLSICGQSTFAIDSSCTNTPVINISFDGDIKVDSNLSVKNRYNVDHYQKLTSMDGTTIVEDFISLDNEINSYLNNPKLKSEGRDKIINNFAGFFNKLSSERITERIIKLIG